MSKTTETQPSSDLRDFYQQGIAAVRARFEHQQSTRAAGHAAVHERAQLADELVRRLWQKYANDPKLRSGVALVAIGGYGRIVVAHNSLAMLSARGTGPEPTLTT